jgi:hypothetical protein
VLHQKKLSLFFFCSPSSWTAQTRERESEEEEEEEESDALKNRTGVSSNGCFRVRVLFIFSPRYRFMATIYMCVVDKSNFFSFFFVAGCDGAFFFSFSSKTHFFFRSKKKKKSTTT